MAGMVYIQRDLKNITLVLHLTEAVVDRDKRVDVSVLVVELESSRKAKTQPHEQVEPSLNNRNMTYCFDLFDAHLVELHTIPFSERDVRQA